MNKCNICVHQIIWKLISKICYLFRTCGLEDVKIDLRSSVNLYCKSVLFTPQLAIICLASLLTFNFLNNPCFFTIFLPLPRYRRLDYFIVQTKVWIS